MSKNRAITTILEQEQRLGLWQERLFGFPIWSTERLLHYRMLKDGSLPHREQTTRTQNMQRDLTDVTASSRALMAWFKQMRTRDIWVLSSNLYRRGSSPGVNPCLYTLDLETQLGPRLLFLETDSPNHSLPSQDNVVYLDSIHGSLRVLARSANRLLGSALARSSKPLFEVLSAPRRRPAIIQSIASKALYELSLRLLRAGKPKAVFVLCAYNKHVPIQLAARDLGIPIIELQHGMIHESHPGYILPSMNAPQERHLPFPDHLVVFGDYFGQLLDRESPRWRGKWSIGGHPQLRRLRASATGTASDTRPLPHVVFFSQFESEVQQQIDRVAAEFRALNDHCRVSIKPHPRERAPKSIYAHAETAGVEILSASDNAYRILETTDVAVTVFSTLAIEALVYPCRSVVLESRNWSEPIESLLHEGYLESANGAEQLAALLASSPAARDRAEISRRLFGVGERELDFQALIERCSQPIK